MLEFTDVKDMGVYLRSHQRKPIFYSLNNDNYSTKFVEERIGSRKRRLGVDDIRIPSGTKIVKEKNNYNFLSKDIVSLSDIMKQACILSETNKSYSLLYDNGYYTILSGNVQITDKFLDGGIVKELKPGIYACKPSKEALYVLARNIMGMKESYGILPNMLEDDMSLIASYAVLHNLNQEDFIGEISLSEYITTCKEKEVGDGVYSLKRNVISRRGLLWNLFKIIRKYGSPNTMLFWDIVTSSWYLVENFRTFIESRDVLISVDEISKRCILKEQINRNLF